MDDRLLAGDTLLRDWWVGVAPSWLDGPMWLLSAIGVAASIWLLIALQLALYAPRLRAAAWQVVIAVLLAQFVTDQVLKPFVERPRPSTVAGARVIGQAPETHSFPSGHATSSFAAATVLAFALRRRPARAAAFVLAALIALSRVHVGVHYPLDVLAGSLLGLTIGVVVTGGRAWYSGGSSVVPHPVPR
jgi:undecaprenyl-diphosphatase